MLVWAEALSQSRGSPLALMVQSLLVSDLAHFGQSAFPTYQGNDAGCIERWYIGPWDASRALVGQVGTGVPTAAAFSCPEAGLVRRP